MSNVFEDLYTPNTYEIVRWAEEHPEIWEEDAAFWVIPQHNYLNEQSPVATHIVGYVLSRYKGDIELYAVVLRNNGIGIFYVDDKPEVPLDFEQMHDNRWAMVDGAFVIDPAGNVSLLPYNRDEDPVVRAAIKNRTFCAFARDLQAARERYAIRQTITQLKPVIPELLTTNQIFELSLTGWNLYDKYLEANTSRRAIEPVSKPTFISRQNPCVLDEPDVATNGYVRQFLWDTINSQLLYIEIAGPNPKVVTPSDTIPTAGVWRVIDRKEPLFYPSGQTGRQQFIVRFGISEFCTFRHIAPELPTEESFAVSKNEQLMEALKKAHSAYTSAVSKRHAVNYVVNGV